MNRARHTNGHLFDAAKANKIPSYAELEQEREQLREALDNLRLSASRVANKYGRDPETDELLDWEEWRAVREHCESAAAALNPQGGRNAG